MSGVLAAMRYRYGLARRAHLSRRVAARRALLRQGSLEGPRLPRHPAKGKRGW